MSTRLPGSLRQRRFGQVVRGELRRLGGRNRVRDDWAEVSSGSSLSILLLNLCSTELQLSHNYSDSFGKVLISNLSVRCSVSVHLLDARRLLSL